MNLPKPPWPDDYSPSPEALADFIRALPPEGAAAVCGKLQEQAEQTDAEVRRLTTELRRMEHGGPVAVEEAMTPEGRAINEAAIHEHVKRRMQEAVESAKRPAPPQITVDQDAAWASAKTSLIERINKAEQTVGLATERYQNIAAAHAEARDELEAAHIDLAGLRMLWQTVFEPVPRAPDEGDHRLDANGFIQPTQTPEQLKAELRRLGIIREQ
jgi:hypothetical protein